MHLCHYTGTILLTSRHMSAVGTYEYLGTVIVLNVAFPLGSFDSWRIVY